MLDQKNTCEYMYQGKLLQLSASEKERFRNRHMSYITQHALLFAHNTVLDNLKFYLRDDDADKRAEELLQMAGLIEERKKCVRLLSGGERQRLVVLCAMAADREIILGDEITAALDQENKAIVRRLMRQCADEGKTVILVTHDEKVTEMADRVYQLSHCELQLLKQTWRNRSLRRRRRLKRYLPIISTGTCFSRAESGTGAVFIAAHHRRDIGGGVRFGSMEHRQSDDHFPRLSSGHGSSCGIAARAGDQTQTVLMRCDSGSNRMEQKR